MKTASAPKVRLWMFMVSSPWRNSRSSATVALHTQRAFAIDVGVVALRLQNMLRNLAIGRAQAQQVAGADGLDCPPAEFCAVPAAVAAGAAAGVSGHARMRYVGIRAIAAKMQSLRRTPTDVAAIAPAAVI